MQGEEEGGEKLSSPNAIMPSDKIDKLEEEQSEANSEKGESGMGKEIENISAMELSHKEIDLENFKESVMREIAEQSRGQRGGSELLENIDPVALRHIKAMEMLSKDKEMINV